MSPDDLVGAWRRAAIAWPDGRRDGTTWVLWLQARTAFADIRLGTDGHAEGFAGTIAVEGDVCTWHREVDISPPSAPDMGRLMRVSDTALLEDGVLTAYREDWLREPAVAPTLVLRRPGALLVGVGICVLRASARAVDYWPAGAAAVARSTDPSRIGLPLSFVRHGGEVVEVDGTRWQVAESSADEPLALLDGGAP